MKRKRRASGVASVGLFYFQDIIFLTIGIVILVSALLALSNRMSLISTRSESARDIEANLDAAIVELAFWQRVEQMLERGQLPPAIEMKREVEASGRPAVPERALAMSGVDQEALYVATGALLSDDQEVASYQTVLQERQARASSAIAELIRLEEAYRERKAQLLELEGNRRRIIVRPEAEDSLLEPVVVELSIDGLKRLNPPKGRSAKLTKPPFDTVRLREALKAAGSSETHVLVLVKPSGASLFGQLRETLVTSGYAFGYEPVAESYVFESKRVQIMEVLP